MQDGRGPALVRYVGETSNSVPTGTDTTVDSYYRELTSALVSCTSSYIKQKDTGSRHVCLLDYSYLFDVYEDPKVPFICPWAMAEKTKHRIVSPKLLFQKTELPPNAFGAFRRTSFIVYLVIFFVC